MSDPLREAVERRLSEFYHLPSEVEALFERISSLESQLQAAAEREGKMGAALARIGARRCESLRSGHDKECPQGFAETMGGTLPIEDQLSRWCSVCHARAALSFSPPTPDPRDRQIAVLREALVQSQNALSVARAYWRTKQQDSEAYADQLSDRMHLNRPVISNTSQAAASFEARVWDAALDALVVAVRTKAEEAPFEDDFRRIHGLAEFVATLKRGAK